MKIVINYIRHNATFSETTSLKVLIKITDLVKPTFENLMGG